MVASLGTVCLRIDKRSVFRGNNAAQRCTCTTLKLTRKSRGKLGRTHARNKIIMDPKEFALLKTTQQLVLKIRFKPLPPIQLSGCFGLDVTSWTCGTSIPSSNPAVCSSCVTFSPLFFLFLTYVLTQMTRKKSLWAIKIVLHASHHPPPLS